MIIPIADPDFLGDCLRALAAQSSRRFEVIVVENGPRNPHVGEQVAGIAKDQPNRYLYERTPGLNGARNRGCRAARHEILALLDDDCVPAKNWVAAILDHHRRFSNAGVIGGQVQLRFLAERPEWLAGKLL